MHIEGEHVSEKDSTIDLPQLVDTSGRSATPPDTAYYVVWGRARLKNSRLYRDAGWARNRVRIASQETKFVRIYETDVLSWNDVTNQHQDVVDDAKIIDLLNWAGTNRIKRAILDTLDAPQLAEFIQKRESLDQTVEWFDQSANRITEFVDRLRRE